MTGATPPTPDHVDFLVLPIGEDLDRRPPWLRPPRSAAQARCCRPARSCTPPADHHSGDQLDPGGQGIKKTNSTHTHTHQRTREQPAAVSCWLRLVRGSPEGAPRPAPSPPSRPAAEQSQLPAAHTASAAAAGPERRRRRRAGRHQGKNGANKAAAAANRPPLTYQRAWELLDPVRQPLERRRPATTGSKSCD